MRSRFLIIAALGIVALLLDTTRTHAQEPKQVAMECRFIQTQDNFFACIGVHMDIPKGSQGVSVGPDSQQYERIVGTVNPQAHRAQALPVEGTGLYHMLGLNGVDVQILAWWAWLPLFVGQFEEPSGQLLYLVLEDAYAGSLRALVAQAASTQQQVVSEDKITDAAVTPATAASVKTADVNSFSVDDAGSIYSMSLTTLSGENIVNSWTCASGARALVMQGTRVARLVIEAVESAKDYVVLQLRCVGGFETRH